MDTTDRNGLNALASTLERAAAALRKEGLRNMRLLDAKAILLASLDEIDRRRFYGNPGRAIDDFLDTKEMANG